MELSAGHRLGPYEILAPIGAGGMGEVYRARDARLGRDVAVKVLPAAATSSAEALARFEREARALSQLHHPRVCSVFDVGAQDGVPYFVMELLEGETLGSRLTRGPLAVRELLKIAIQVAEGLDAAHRAGIVHRDLKPGNVMLAQGGAKLLDFGLARAADAFRSFDAVGSASPTRSLDLTSEGTIVGTLRNMAPEQLEGGPIDTRTDLFAFGGMLHEMASGKPAFEAKSRASLVAAILKETPPPLDALAPGTPAALARVVTRCLEKNPDDRWQSTRDLLHELRWIEESITSSSGSAARAGATAVGSAPSDASPAVEAARRRPPSRTRGFLSEIVTAAFAVGITLFISSRVRVRDDAAPLAAWRFEVPLPLARGLPYGIAFSPDGRSLAFVAGAAAEISLWIRSPDSITPRRLEGTAGGRFPFWAPDGASIGFFADSKLKRIDLDGGAVRVVCDAADGRGGTWNGSGDILFSPNRDGVIHRVSARGGTPKPETAADSSKVPRSHRWPWFLPDGRHFLFQVPGMPGHLDEVRLAEVGKVGFTKILEGTSRAEFDRSGNLLYVRDRTLFAHRFDPRRGTLVGDPIPLEENVEKTGEDGPTGYAAFAGSPTGDLAFARPFSRTTTNLVWVDRAGAPLDTIGTSASYDEPAISPDGNWLAVNSRRSEEERDDLWLVDLRRETFSRLTFDPALESAACWSPDGKWIAYSSEKSGNATVYRMLVEGSRDEEALVDSTSTGKGRQWSDQWSPDGKYLLIDFIGLADDADRYDLHLLPMDGALPAATIPFLETKFRETHANVSPDSRWVAYTSSESGIAEIYVQSFPTPGSKWKISEHGGDQACWRGDGRELYFLSFDCTIMAVDVTTGERFEAGTPRRLFPSRTRDPDPDGSRAYFAPAADGQRFLVCMSSEELESAPIFVRTNWRAALE